MAHLAAHLVWMVFVLLALWHVGMAAMPPSGRSGAVPTVGGKALFTPSRLATLAVAAVLLMFAALVAATAGLIDSGISRTVLAGLCYALATGLLVRAIGEFKYLGLFKRMRASRFATLDTWVYSPLCLLLAAGVASVAHAATT